MEQEIKNLSQEIKKQAQRTQEKARKIREQEEIAREIKIDSFTGTVTGVDGGLIAQDLQGTGIVVTRACAANMKYKKGRLVDHSYYPNPSPDLEVSSIDPKRSNKIPNLLRAIKEIETARESLENNPTDYLLLDGSIVPNPSDKPKEENQKEREKYQELIEKYKKLFKTARNKGTQVIGVVEDSKSRKIAKKHGEDKLDSILMHYVLEEDERTKKFNYSDEPGNHPVLRDLPPDIRNAIKVVYLKLVKNDKPLRIEYLEGEKNLSDMIDLLGSLSKISSDYSYPAPLIEADLHAKISEKEADSVIEEVKTYVGEEPFMMKERRDKRPFK